MRARCWVLTCSAALLASSSAYAEPSNSLRIVSTPAISAALASPAGPLTARPGEAGPAQASPAASASAEEVAPSRVLDIELRRGESLYGLFSRYGLSHADLIAMERADRRIRRELRRLRPGRLVRLEASADGRLQRVWLQRPGPRDLLIELDESDGFRMREVIDPAPTPGLAAAAAAAIAPPPQPTPVDQDTDAPPQSQSESAERPAEDSESAESDTELQTVTVRRGDSLYTIFKQLGLSPTELANLIASGQDARRLRSLKPGQTLELGIGDDALLRSLVVELDETRTLESVRDGDGFTTRIHERPLEVRVASASAVIESSLFLAGQRQGLSDRVIMQLVEIFGWDVDFALDVRAGDRFTLVYEELYKDGQKVRDGRILASEFFNRGRSIRAVRYVYEDGRAEYFSPDGLSMRKAFLRTPLKFSRISSRFSNRRMHPVLQRMRAHKGVDYAAPTGTPIKVTGDGRVTFAGWKNGFGKTVIVQHGAAYTTLYGHLSRIHKRARAQRRVKQGEIIGYVGQTGLASGPHLHYEFRVRGVHKNPLRVKLPKALPIEARYRDDFARKSRPLLAKLDSLAETTSIASSD